MNRNWQPPFLLHAAGYGRAVNKAYYNDADDNSSPRRILFKRTISGTGVLYINGHRQLLHANDIMVIERPGPYVYCFESSFEPWQFEYISVSYNSKDFFLPEHLRHNPVFSLSSNDPFVESMQKLIKLRSCPNYTPELSHSAMGYQLLLNYIAMRSRGTAKAAPAAEQLKSLIEQNFSETITLNELIVPTGYTQEALTRLFTRTYGVSPGKYLQLIRLRHACRFLENSSNSIKEVAVLCGFASQNYFCRLFKKTMKVSPGHYRKNPDPFMPERLNLEKPLNPII